MRKKVGVLQMDHHLHRVNNEVGNSLDAVEFHPFDNRERCLHGLGGKATALMAESLLAEMVPTWAISFWPLIGLDIILSSSTTASTTALSIPRIILFLAISPYPIALVVILKTPSIHLETDEGGRLHQ